MTCPRLEIRLDHIGRNAQLLGARLGARGIGVTAVTKATGGSPEVARVLLDAGAQGLGDSRIDNVERLRAGGITAHITLIRSPMLSQVARVVALVERSLNVDRTVLAALSREAVRQQRIHGVILMVELGDLREGIMPAALPEALRFARSLANIEVEGIGANLACQHGIVPDDENMGLLSTLAEHAERAGTLVATVSGGNSAAYDWAMATPDVGRVNDLRLGEAILLGRQPLDRHRIDGLQTDACTLVGEVIERSTKPTEPWGLQARTAFGPADERTGAVGMRTRAIVALGRQDADPDGLVPPPGTAILGASSDHLVLGIDGDDVAAEVGDTVRFGLDYASLLRATSSPSVARSFVGAP